MFECTVSDSTFHQMKGRLLDIIDEDQDSIRFYKLPDGRENRVEEFGVGKVIDFTGPAIRLTRTPSDAVFKQQVRVRACTMLTGCDPYGQFCCTQPTKQGGSRWSSRNFPNKGVAPGLTAGRGLKQRSGSCAVVARLRVAPGLTAGRGLKPHDESA